MKLPHICVCACTYKRPQMLSRLVESLSCQDTEDMFTFSVVIADNDATESARSHVEALRSCFRLQITYCVEPEQNIALARNRALGAAQGDYIAFIDDDEFAEPNWLRNLFLTCNRNKADGVLGPVRPFFEKQPPRWIVRGGFYNRLEHDTGFVIPWTEGRTGNLLFKTAILDGVDPVFRREFGSGGEDRDFFMRMIAAGRVFVWCNEAIAYELVPPARCKRSFMLRRALLRGKVSLNHKSIGFRGVLKSMAAIPLYALALPFLLVRGQHMLMKYLVKLCDHAGRICAFLGVNPVKETYVTE